MDTGELQIFESMVSRVVKEAATAASIETLKGVSHNYPSDACKIFMASSSYGIEKSLAAIDVRLGNIESDIKSIMTDLAELDKKVRSHDDDIKDLKRFQSVQKWVLGALWAIVSAWIIGGGFVLFRLLGERLVGGR